MRAPPLVSDFFEWRWAPCVGLTAGSLAFVALALLLIPVQFDGTAGDSSASRSSRSSREGALLDRTVEVPPRALFGASLPRGLREIGRAPDPSNPGRERQAPLSPNEQVAPTQRGFSPIIDRPEPAQAPLPSIPPPPVPPAPPPAVETAPLQQPPPLPAPSAPPTSVAQQPQPDPDGPRREVLAQ
jgi:hypothetical protein